MSQPHYSKVMSSDDNLFFFVEQKAWRKRQLSYRLSEKSSVFLAITDIIILSKSKKAPEGFTMAGEVNGLLVCYKSAPLPTTPNPLSNVLPTPLSVNVKPVATENNPPNLPSRNSNSNQPISPVRPAPLPPAANKDTSSSEINTSSTRLVVISSSTLSGSTGSYFSLQLVCHCLRLTAHFLLSRT